METRNISYDGKYYKVATITLPNGREVDIAEEELWESIREDYYWGDKEAEDIDDSIFYYVEKLGDFSTNEDLLLQLKDYIEEEI